MLQRSEGSDAGVDCDDPVVALACSLDTDECPAACKSDSKDDDEVVKAGSLVVSVVDDSSKTISVPRSGIITLASVDLDSSESITLDNITVSRIGLSSKTDVKSIWFEKNGVRISGKASLASDGKASVTFNNGLTVKSSDTIDLVAELDAAAGSELQFEITKVESSAKDYNIKGGKTPTYRTVNYTVANVTFVKKGNDAEYKLGDQDSYEIAKFNIENNNNTGDDKDVKVESIILKNIGTADLENLDNIVVYRDSKKVSEKVTVNGKNLEITLNDTIESGKKGIYTVEANITYVDRATDTYQLSLNKTADLVAYETSTNMRVTLNVTTPLELATYTVKGGKMVFATASDSPKTVDAGISYSDVVLAEGTLTIAEPVKFDSLTLGANVTAGTNTLSKILKKVRLEIGNSSYTATIDDTGKLVFDNEMYVSKTSKVKVIADIASTANNDDKVSIDPIKGGSFAGGEYQNSSNSFTGSAIAGSVTIAKLTIKEAKFNMTKTSKSSEVKVVETVNEEVSVFNGKITNNQNSALTVNDLTLKLSSDKVWTSNEEIYFTLKIGDKTVSKTYKNTNTSLTGEVVFSSLGIDLAKDASVEFEVLASATTLATTNSTNFTIEAIATGTDGNGNDSKTNAIFVTNYKIVEGGSATTAKSAVVNSAFIQNTDDNVIAEWTVTVKDEDLTLKGITLGYDSASTAISNNTLNTWKVTYGSKELNGSLSKNAGNTGLVMEDLNETLKPGTYNFKAIANFGTVTAGSGLLNITTIDMDIEGVQGKVSVPTVSAGYRHAVLKAVPVISFVKTREEANDVSKYFAVKVSNPSSSEESITLNSFDYSGNQASNVKATYGSNRSNFDSGSVVLAPGNTETIYFEAATPLSGGTSFDFSVDNLVYTVDNATISNLNSFNNAVAWADLKVSGRITN